MNASAHDILAQLAAVGATVELRGERVFLRPGAKLVPPRLIKEARAAKPELRRLIGSADDRHRCSPGTKDAQPAAVSIYGENEHLCGAVEPSGPRVLAREGWADGVARLDPEQPPADVPSRRWRRFVDDARCFLSSDFAVAAVAFGWEPLDLFGCDADRPFARIDRAGLLWLLDGSRLVALTAQTATVETSTGARQTWRRKPAEPGRVLAWELAS